MRKQTTRPEIEQHLTINEVATRLDLSPWTVREWIKDGKLPAIKLGTSARAPIRVRVSDVEALLNPVTPKGA